MIAEYARGMPTDELEPITTTQAFSATAFDGPADRLLGWVWGRRAAGKVLSLGAVLLPMLPLIAKNLQVMASTMIIVLAMVAWRRGKADGEASVATGGDQPRQDHAVVANGWATLCFGIVLLVVSNVIVVVSAPLRSGVAPWALALAALSSQWWSWNEWRSAMKLEVTGRRGGVVGVVVGTWLLGTVLLAVAMVATGTAEMNILSAIVSAMMLASFWGLIHFVDQLAVVAAGAARNST
jgi:hypothetical protein